MNHFFLCGYSVLKFVVTCKCKKHHFVDFLYGKCELDERHCNDHELSRSENLKIRWHCRIFQCNLPALEFSPQRVFSYSEFKGILNNFRISNYFTSCFKHAISWSPLKVFGMPRAIFFVIMFIIPLLMRSVWPPPILECATLTDFLNVVVFVIIWTSTVSFE